MKRFLTTTTALSVALSGMPGFPLLAQTQVQVGDQVVICLPDASVACPDGASCVIIPEAPCDPGAVESAAQAAAAAIAAQETAAAAEVAAQEAAAAEAAAQEAAAAAEIAAQDAAAAEAAAAEVAAQDAAAAEAAAQAAAAEAAAAEAAAQAAAAEAAAAEVAAQDAAAAEAAAAEVAAQDAAAAEAAAAEVAAQDAAAAEATAAEVAAQDAAAAEAAAAEVAAQDAAAAEAAAAEVAAQDAAAAEATAAEVAAQDAAAAEAAAAEVAAQDAAAAEAAAAEVAAQDAAAAEAAAAAAEVAAQDAAPALEVVETAPVANEAAVEQLTSILTGTDDGDTVAPVAAAAVAAAALAAASAGGAASDTTAPDATVAPTATTVTEVTAEDSRSSAEEFVDTSVAATAAATAAPTVGTNKTASKKKKGLSDFEKFGLAALGVLAVGAVLSNGNKVVSNTGDRVVVRGDDGRYQVLKDDDTLIRRPGSTVRTESYDDGSTRSIVERDDGSRIITIRDASGRVLRRSRINTDGREVLLIDDLAPVERIDVATLPTPRPGRNVISTQGDDAALRAALLGVEARDLGRSFSLRQIRDYSQVRALAPTIDVENVTFETGSAAIRAAEAQKLAKLGRLMADLVEQNPAEMFLIEGHTDAVGSEAFNLALSDQRAESLALALSEYFGVPPENMVVQGYGETELRINTLGNEPLNRRAAVRIITPLLLRLATR